MPTKGQEVSHPSKLPTGQRLGIMAMGEIPNKVRGRKKKAIWSPKRGGENTKNGLPCPLNVGDDVTHNDYLEKG